MMAIPVLLGVAYTIVATLILCLLCYRELRVRDRTLPREADHRRCRRRHRVVVDRGFERLVRVVRRTLVARQRGDRGAALISDRPKGYIQRVAMGIFAYTLFGALLGHLSFFANLPNYRAILFWLVLCVEMNDIFAYIAGKTFGERRLSPAHQSE